MGESIVEDNIQCYNRGCQKKYNLTSNKIDACCHHPGVPVFHDALKGWSCCKKRTTDFTMFLNMTGCTFGFHSNKKPEALTERPGIKDDKTKESVAEVVEEVANKPVAPPTSFPRPTADEQKIRLTSTSNDSTKNALSKQIEILSNLKISEDTQNYLIYPELSCPVYTPHYFNLIASPNKLLLDLLQQYDGVSVNKCQYHPGLPVFHEGMKFWSCCTMKTTDFSKFLEQLGCEHLDSHLWSKPSESTSDELKPRIDWFQTGTKVTISLFSKFILPDSVKVEVNQVQMSVEYIALSANSNDRPVYKNVFELCEAISPLQCSVKVMPSKLEINLRKGGPSAWKTLEVTEA